jgi:hypothetical protein
MGAGFLDENLRDWDRGIEVGFPVWSNGRGVRRPRGTRYGRTYAGSGGIRNRWWGCVSLRLLMKWCGRVVIRRLLIPLLEWGSVEWRLLIPLLWRVPISLVVSLRRVLLLLLLSRRVICKFLELCFTSVE